MRWLLQQITVSLKMRNSAHVEIARHASRCMDAAEVQSSTFSVANWSSSVEFGITVYYNPGIGVGLQIAKTLTCPLMSPLHFLYTTLIHHFL